MKIDWKFVVLVLGFSFALGFAKPAIEPQVHTVLSFVVYGGIWIFYRKTAVSNSSDYIPFFNFIGRLLVFFFTLRIFSEVINSVPEYKSVLVFPYLVVIVIGGGYCFSFTVRMYLNNLWKKIMRRQD